MLATVTPAPPGDDVLQVVSRLNDLSSKSVKIIKYYFTSQEVVARRNNNSGRFIITANRFDFVWWFVGSLVS